MVVDFQGTHMFFSEQKIPTTANLVLLGVIGSWDPFFFLEGWNDETCMAHPMGWILVDFLPSIFSAIAFGLVSFFFDHWVEDTEVLPAFLTSFLFVCDFFISKPPFGEYFFQPRQANLKACQLFFQFFYRGSKILTRWFNSWPNLIPQLEVTMRSPITFERVMFSPSQRGHKELPGSSI